MLSPITYLITTTLTTTTSNDVVCLSPGVLLISLYLETLVVCPQQFLFSQVENVAECHYINGNIHGPEYRHLFSEGSQRVVLDEALNAMRTLVVKLFSLTTAVCCK